MAMIQSSRGRALGVLLAIVALTATAMAQDFGGTVIKRGVVEGDLYLAGRTIEVAARVEGDLVAAGQRVNVTEPVAEDVMAAGEVVTLAGAVKDDVRSAGRLVTLAAAVGDHAVAAGETVTLAAGASTGSYAWFAGRLVQVLGDVGGELRAAGQEVVIGGTVTGDATVAAQRIRILETARIHGRLSYRSPTEPEIDPGALIDGDILSIPVPDSEKAARGVAGAALGTAVMLALGLFVVGAAYILTFPGVAADAAGTATRRIWAVLGLGLAVLLGVPFVGVLLAVTVVGLVAGFVVLVLYLVLLLAGYLNGVAWLSRLGLQRLLGGKAPGRGVLLFAFLLGLVVLLGIQVVPVLGQLAGLFVWLAGIGSLVMVVVGRYRASPLPAAS